MGLIEGGRGGGFDELGAMNPFVLKNKKDAKYLMAYEGVGVDGGRSNGLAVSQDGFEGLDKTWLCACLFQINVVKMRKHAYKLIYLSYVLSVNGTYLSQFSEILPLLSRQNIDENRNTQ
ncbi:uncharacterized protein Pyn_19375 [Prunus yedoensis var. nudiflora]|uniref:Uncharacterized protein n=1 Tax=Prunus yedoensis var. nudiflora TaxID=2094558 RepID=A0A314UBI2_PRUYE|nr:uncharacterized protein Pyn_19375 [Prunus yedoensis var. nudiflora]